ncbi:GNAT family N-acetyltransferase [Pengzhenrongella frigida]|uniref:N-acetyltransferase n=1 Tax=Pengzhenrongella frigida TaxID=1259133 RepID=A0A4Q5N311_9MICO|nr:N-acetyltransferase [Cellulomonas sp. HLT2-17]RYV51643.1 N-acetyltransferase [Cellulomonas sp. HLT2-17]
MNLGSDPAPVPAPDYPEVAATALPPGWVAVTPQAVDAGDLLALLHRHELVAHGSASTTRATVDGDLSAAGLQTRRHQLLRDESARARAWATIYDRAAGRVLVSVVVDPDLEPRTADLVADALFTWAAYASADLGFDRGLAVTQMDSGAFADDARQQRWLANAGFTHTRTWWQMSRPVTPADAAPEGRSEPHPGVVVRRVRLADDGLPAQVDLITVHDVLEEAFTDHFNHHVETFDEFTSRLREDPGHRWDHWWIAELVDDSSPAPRPAGVLVGAVSPGAGDAPDGSYVAYLGVLQSARGRGVARSLLTAVVVDAAERGRDRVGLEVDADSPTGAVDLYTSEGFRTAYITQSWHRDLPVGS